MWGRIHYSKPRESQGRPWHVASKISSEYRTTVATMYLCIRHMAYQVALNVTHAVHDEVAILRGPLTYKEGIAIDLATINEVIKDDALSVSDQHAPTYSQL